MHVFNRLKIHHHISAKTVLCLTFRAVKCITSCNPLYQTFKLSYTRDVKVDNLYSLIKQAKTQHFSIQACFIFMLA